jgi:transcriptional regulator with XRE-family HTH domain
MRQQTVAAAAGIDSSYLSLIETGHRKPSWEVTQRLAEALGIEPSVLNLLASDDPIPDPLRVPFALCLLDFFVPPKKTPEATPRG